MTSPRTPEERKALAAGECMSTALHALEEIASLGPEQDPGEDMAPPNDWDAGAVAAAFTTAKIARTALSKIAAVMATLEPTESQP